MNDTTPQPQSAGRIRVRGDISVAGTILIFLVLGLAFFAFARGF